jgi:hypothetical protein
LGVEDEVGDRPAGGQAELGVESVVHAEVDPAYCVFLASSTEAGKPAGDAACKRVVGGTDKGDGVGLKKPL